jgi:hypothetical protein
MADNSELIRRSLFHEFGQQLVLLVQFGFQEGNAAAREP